MAPKGVPRKKETTWEREEFIAYLKGHGLADSTIASYVAIVRVYLAFLEEREK